MLVTALSRNVVDESWEGECGYGIEEPVHLIGRWVYSKIECASDCSEPHSDCVSDDWRSLWLSEEHWNEECSGYLCEPPPEEYGEQDSEAGFLENLYVEYLHAAEHEEESGDEVEDEVEHVVDLPVLAHLHAVDLHVLNQTRLLLQHDLVQEHRQTHAHAKREDHETDHWDALLDVRLEVRLERVKIHTAYHSRVVEQLSHVSLIE